MNKIVNGVEKPICDEEEAYLANRMLELDIPIKQEIEKIEGKSSLRMIREALITGNINALVEVEEKISALRQKLHVMGEDK